MNCFFLRGSWNAAMMLKIFNYPQYIFWYQSKCSCYYSGRGRVGVSKVNLSIYKKKIGENKEKCIDDVYL